MLTHQSILPNAKLKTVGAHMKSSTTPGKSPPCSSPLAEPPMSPGKGTSTQSGNSKTHNLNGSPALSWGAVFLVREGGVEPPHPFEYTDLNRARLPIPPLALFSFAEASQGYRLRSLEVHGSLSDYLRARQVCQHWH